MRVPRPGPVLRIARWETTRRVGRPSRRGVVAVLVVALALGAVVPAAFAGGVALDSGLYRVGVTPESPFYDVAQSDPTFRVAGAGTAAVDDGRLSADEGYELVARGGGVYLASDGDGPTAKSRAALAALRESTERYNDRRMLEEADATAAFPVFPVTLRYAERETVRERLVVPTGVEGADGASGPDVESGDGGTDSSTGTDGRGDTAGSGGGFGLPAVDVDFLGTGTTAGTPSDIAPPFPFQSLVLAFAFVVPLNFVVQAYSSSVLAERIDRRGELLLVAPVGPGEIVAGKTLPYLSAAVGVGAVIAGLVGGGPLSVLAVTSLALFFLGATFLGAMLARSFKELTFVTVAVSVSLTTFAFVPAIFTDVGPVALVSPLTLVVRDLSGAGVPAGDVAFATLPSTLAALVLFGFGVGLYREEDMFTQRPVPLKLLDALAGRIRRPRSVALVTALLVPFVFVAELLAVAVLFALPGGLSVPLLLTVVALVEEVAKSLPALAGFERARFGRDARTALVVGAASGTGFFLAEKLTLVVQLVGLPELRVGSAAFGVAPGLGPLTMAALLVAPLALHVVTACIGSVGASRGTDGWLAGLGVAVLVHLGYNLLVVTSLV